MKTGRITGFLSASIYPVDCIYFSDAKRLKERMENKISIFYSMPVAAERLAEHIKNVGCVRKPVTQGQNFSQHFVGKCDL